MNSAEIDRLQADDQMLEPLGADIWLMDDHRWAFYVWQRFSIEEQIRAFSLVHADYHWDATNDFFEDEQARRRLENADLPQLYEMVLKREGIAYDSFIAPALIRGFINDVHFFCKQNDSDRGLDDELLASANVRQCIHETTESLLSADLPKPVIFDLCLDLFNDEETTLFGEGDLWPDAKVEGWLTEMRTLIERAALVTVSLSFDYSGAADDTRHLAALVLPRILQWRGAA
ncbi:UPF0489 family protein [Pandoraea bronchicola]|uniref:Uncharacterized protein n=1 Tax=Pandoraea bronchicola TaxID=2508287 RepID=A0A5E5BNZ8_9BURK|nr:UPF0489 family protein [Pandoraea bronchicola]VVE87088.1 hypothetical protein PBR20603_01013 [Pandoraea bronchicola]